MKLNPNLKSVRFVALSPACCATSAFKKCKELKRPTGGDQISMHMSSKGLQPAMVSI